MQPNDRRPTSGKGRRYAKAAIFVLIPVLVIAGLLAALVGPVTLGQLATRINRLGSASAGNLAGMGAGQRDVRFGIAEGHKNSASKDTGIGFQRQTFAWTGIQPNGPGDWNADFYFPNDLLDQQLNAGVQVVGLLQFTPGWAQANPGAGERSLPKNVGLAYNDPNNYWGAYTRRLASHYAGRINHWVIWNEPEIRPTDAGAGSAWTFDGGPDEYAQLLRVAYMNIKEANPNAQVVFAGTAYWLDKNSGREQFFKRTLDVIAADPNAGANNFYFDAAAFNIYYGADTIYRLGTEYRAIMQAKGINKELWLTETNAPPADPGVPCADRFLANPSSVSLDVHGNYAMQSMAMGLAGGWNRVEFYQMTDSGTCNESAIWGLLRDDGTPRPAFNSFKTVVNQLGGASNITFAPYERENEAWGTPWPYNPETYYPNWQVYQVVGDRGDQRISLLWNGDGSPLRARIPKVGSSAVIVDQYGNEQPINDQGGWYVVDLAPATARSGSDPNGYFYVGGQTQIIVQSGVPAGTPISTPALGDPGSSAREFKVQISPANGQKISSGQSTQFTLRVRGFEGFNDPINVTIKEYTNAGDRTPREVPSQISLNVAPTIQANSRVDIQVATAPDLPSSLHFITVELSGGGITHTVDLVLEN